MDHDTQGPSTRPYLLRALYEWCSDNGLTPYIAVHVDESTRVPVEYVDGGEIVLNVAMDATSGLKLGNEFVEFRARFGGVARDIVVPVENVIAIYARETGQGMAFTRPAPHIPLERAPQDPSASEDGSDDQSSDMEPPQNIPPHPFLKRIK
jgi:stringent starvation protein B